MAGDWIKFRTDLHTDPAVIRLGEVLNANLADEVRLDSFSIVGRLAAVWVWAATHADSTGRVALVSRSCVDGVAQWPGFGAAMESVGWLATSPDADGISFPKFERHMGEGAKARALAAERKRKQRKKEARTRHAGQSPTGHARVTPKSQDSVTREEKRREEES